MCILARELVIKKPPGRVTAPCRAPRRRRSGAVMVEMALTLPIFLLLVFGIIEFGRALMVQQVVTNAAREGARHGVLPGVTTAAAKQKVKDHLAAENLDVPQATITVTPAELSTTKTGTMIMVSVSIPYSAVGWVAQPWFVGGTNLKSQCTMRHE